MIAMSGMSEKICTYHNRNHESLHRTRHLFLAIGLQHNTIVTQAMSKRRMHTSMGSMPVIYEYVQGRMISE